MRKLLLFGLVSQVVLAVAVPAAYGAVEVRTDHADAMYRCGETAVFTVRVTEDADRLLPTGRVSVVVDNFGSRQQLVRDIDLSTANPFTVSGTLSEPGFLRLTLRGAGVGDKFTWSVGYEPDGIRPVTEPPADFDAFWADARKRLAREVPLDARMDRVPERSTAAFDFYRISFATFGRRVHGYMSVPTDRSRAPYPVSVGIAAAGFGHWTNDMAGRSDRICAHFSVYPFEPDWRWKEIGLKEKYDGLNREMSARYGTAYSTAGAGVSREEYFFYPVILGIDRALDWIAARPDVDRGDFSYQGTSQGGGLGLAVTGLNKHITRAVFYVPALTDTLAGSAERQSGWPSPVESQKTDEAKVVAKRTMPYFDGAVFATRITCPVRFAVGLSDTVCAPHCTWGAFNAVAAKDKRLYYGIGMSHGCRAEFYTAFGAWACESRRRDPMTVTLTFDDNPKDMADIVRPALGEYGWKGIFNVVAGWVSEKKTALSWADVRAIRADGHEIASHSLSHPHFRKLLQAGETNEVRRQVFGSRDVLADRLGEPVRWFCYPGNWADPTCRRIVEEAGMRSEECCRPNVGQETPPRTEKGAYVRLLCDWSAGKGCVDLMCHGVRDGHGWKPFADEVQFRRYLDEIKALEQEGVVRVLPYSKAHP